MGTTNFRVFSHGTTSSCLIRQVRRARRRARRTGPYVPAYLLFRAGASLTFSGREFIGVSRVPLVPLGATLQAEPIFLRYMWSRPLGGWASIERAHTDNINLLHACVFDMSAGAFEQPSDQTEERTTCKYLVLAKKHADRASLRLNSEKPRRSRANVSQLQVQQSTSECRGGFNPWELASLSLNVATAQSPSSFISLSGGCTCWIPTGNQTHAASAIARSWGLVQFPAY